MTRTPDSPAQLLSIQEGLDDQTWEDMIMDEITDHDVNEGMALAMRMIQEMINWHDGMAEVSDDPAVWWQDRTQLVVAQNLIKSVHDNTNNALEA